MEKMNPQDLLLSHYYFDDGSYILISLPLISLLLISVVVISLIPFSLQLDYLLVSSRLVMMMSPTSRTSVVTTSTPDSSIRARAPSSLSFVMISFSLVILVDVSYVVSMIIGWITGSSVMFTGGKVDPVVVDDNGTRDEDDCTKDGDNGTKDGVSVEDLLACS